jgi:hypothetical protein
MTPTNEATEATGRDPSPAPGPTLRRKAHAYRFLSRLAFWSPVLAALVLFAQVSFLGLRPAVSEARRLADAEVMLIERHQRAVAENHQVSAQLLARQDPIFRERQRRLRLIEPAAEPETAPLPSRK